MNAFCEHHNNSIKFGYRCFDRILLNGLIQPFQQPERVIGFFYAYPEPSSNLESTLHATEITLSEESLEKLDKIFPGPGGEVPKADAW